MAKKETFREKMIDLCFGIVLIASSYLFLKQMYAALSILIAGALVLIIIYIIYRQKKKRSFFESRNSLEKIRMLTPVQFEEFICKVFDKLGYTTEKVGGSYDGGIDVIATKNGKKHYIQCKKFITSQVSVGAIRDFYGAVTDKLTGAKAFFITTTVFTLEAEKFAEGKPIELIDGNKLMDYVHLAGITPDHVEDNVQNRTNDTVCPKCGAQLVMRTARRGAYAGTSFYGCANYPKCRFTNNAS